MIFENNFFLLDSLKASAEVQQQIVNSINIQQPDNLNLIRQLLAVGIKEIKKEKIQVHTIFNLKEVFQIVLIKL